MTDKYPLPRILALNLLLVALQDCVKPLAIKWDQVNAARKDAIDFLFNKERAEDLKMWCDMAGLNYHNFLKRAREVYDNKIDISKVEVEIPTTTEEDSEDTEDV